jgi:parvulin-like peptidyl-prolyl isomerase
VRVLPRLSSRSLAAVSLSAALVLAGCGEAAISLTGDAAPGLTGFGSGSAAATAEGGIEITADQLSAVADPFIALRAESLPGDAVQEQTLELQRLVLRFMLTSAVFQQQAAELGVTVTDGDVDARMDQIVDEFGGAAAFDQILAEQGVTFGIARLQERANLIRERVGAALAGGQEVTDADVEAALGEAQQVDASHILVETEAEARAVVARLDAGEEFAALAAELSTDPGSGANGGSLGVAPRGSYVPEFESAIWDGPAVVGALLGPVQTQFGFHLIVVNAFAIPTDEDRAEIRLQLESQLGQDLIASWESQALADANPEVASRFGEWNRNTQGVDPLGGLPDPELAS